MTALGIDRCDSTSSLHGSRPSPTTSERTSALAPRPATIGGCPTISSCARYLRKASTTLQAATENSKDI
jgi:hypothetical protein